MYAVARLGDAHRVEHADGFFQCILPAHALVVHQHLGELPADPKIGVEGGHRVLEDHRDLLGADAIEFAFWQVEDLAAVIADAAAGTTVLGQQTHQGEHGLALAGAGFADDAEGLAGFHREADAVDRIDNTVEGVEGDL